MEELHTYALVLLGLAAVLLLRTVGRSVRSHFRRRRAHHNQARRHFVKAASLLAQARSGKLTAGEAKSLAGLAVNEADLATELDPNDAAALIVKSVSLEVLKKPAAAIKVLDAALAPALAGSLSGDERADTLAKRAELVLGQAKAGRRDARMQGVLADLQESIGLKPSNPRVHHMLGTCCERLGDVEDALVAYQQALAVDPLFPDAKAALRRLEQAHPKQPSPPANV